MCTCTLYPDKFSVVSNLSSRSKHSCIFSKRWPSRQTITEIVYTCTCVMQGFVYETAPDFFTSERGWLGYFEEKLFFFPMGKSEDTITVLDPKTLKAETTFELEGKSPVHTLLCS